MSTKRQASFSLKQVLDALDDDDSDFSQGGCSDDSDDEDELYAPDADPDVPSDDDTDAERTSSNGNDGDDCDDDSDDVSGDDDVSIANRMVTKAKGKTTYRWLKKSFEQPDDQFHGETIQPSDPTGITETPLQYFKKFISEDMLELIVEHTNRYSVQKQGMFVNTSFKELEQVLGMYFKMGLVEMPAVRMYWESQTRYPPVTDVMSRNRFQLLLRMIHFVDNLAVSDEDKKDRVWKLRPFLEMFCKQCLQFTPDQHQSIDEMMVPYKGKFSKIRQYIKGKPHPCGFKVWCRCAPSGLLHDFDVYQGKGGEQRKNEFGIGGDAVVKVCETLQKHASYKIYSDNFFTSV